MLSDHLDAIDLRILSALQTDGRLTNQELADRVGLSPSPCLRRVRRLERDGFIRAYRAVLDRESVGLGLTIFVDIRVEKHSRENAAALQEALVAMPEVVTCHMVSGTADCIAEIVVPDLKTYERLLTERLLTLPMIGDIRSNFALTRVKSDGALPLTHLKQELATEKVRDLLGQRERSVRDELRDLSRQSLRGRDRG